MLSTCILTEHTRQQNKKGHVLCPLIRTLTCAIHVTGGMHLPNEELQANDGIDNDHEEHKQRNVQQRNHGFNNGVQHDL